MKEVALFHKLMWKNFTRYFFLGIFIAAMGILAINPGIGAFVDAEMVKDFLFMYVALRMITGMMVTFAEFSLHMLSRRMK